MRRSPARPRARRLVGRQRGAPEPCPTHPLDLHPRQRLDRHRKGSGAGLAREARAPGYILKGGPPGGQWRVERGACGQASPDRSGGCPPFDRNLAASRATQPARRLEKRSRRPEDEHVSPVVAKVSPSMAGLLRHRRAGGTRQAVGASIQRAV